MYLKCGLQLKIPYFLFPFLSTRNWEAAKFLQSSCFFLFDLYLMCTTKHNHDGPILTNGFLLNSSASTSPLAPSLSSSVPNCPSTSLSPPSTSFWICLVSSFFYSSSFLFLLLLLHTPNYSCLYATPLNMSFRICLVSFLYHHKNV